MSEELGFEVDGELAGLDESLAALGKTLGDTEDKAKGLTDALGGVGEALDPVTTETDEGKKEWDSYATAVASVEDTLSVAGQAYDFVFGAASRLHDEVSDSLDAWGEQAKVNLNLADTLQRTGLAGEELKKTFGDLNTLAGEQASATLFGDEEILAAAERYVRISKDATVSQEELSTVLGIASRANKSAEEAATAYAKASKGNVEGMEEYTSLTKEQTAALNKIRDPTKRAKLALELLHAEYEGAAEVVDETTNALKNNADAQGDLRQKIGEVISASGVVSSVMDVMTESTRGHEQAIQDNSVAIQKWILRGADSAAASVEYLTEWVSKNREEVAGAVTFVRMLGKGMVILGKTVGFVGNTIATIATAAMTGFLVATQAVLETAASASRFVGEEGLASDLDDMAESAGAVADEMADLTVSNFNDSIKSAESMTASFDEMGDVLHENDKLARGIGDAAEASAEKVAKVRRNLERAAKNVKDLDPTRPVRDRDPRGDVDTAKLDALAKKEIAREQAKASAKRAQQRIDREILVLQERLLLAQQAGQQAAQISLTYEIDALEAKKTALGVEDRAARAQTERVALLRAELKASEATADLGEKEAEQAKERRAESAEQVALAIELSALTHDLSDTERELMNLEAERRRILGTMEEGRERSLELVRLERQEQTLLAAEARAQLDAQLGLIDRVGSALSSTQIAAAGFGETYAQELERSGELVEALNDQLKTNVFLTEGQRAALEAEIDAEKERQSLIREELALQHQRAQAYGQIATSVGRATLAIHEASQAQDLFAEGGKASAAALSASVAVVGSLASAFIKDGKERAAFQATLEGAAALGAGAAYAASGFTAQNFLVASVQHGAAAVQYAVIAGTSTSVARPSASAAVAPPAASASSASSRRDTGRPSLRDMSDTVAARDARSGGDVYLTLSIDKLTSIGTNRREAEELGRTLADPLLRELDKRKRRRR